MHTIRANGVRLALSKAQQMRATIDRRGCPGHLQADYAAACRVLDRAQQLQDGNGELGFFPLLPILSLIGAAIAAVSAIYVAVQVVPTVGDAGKQVIDTAATVARGLLWVSGAWVAWSMFGPRAAAA